MGGRCFFGLYIIQKRFCRLLEPVPISAKQPTPKKTQTNKNIAENHDVSRQKNTHNKFLDHLCCFEFEIIVLSHPLSHQHIESIFVGFFSRSCSSLTFEKKTVTCPPVTFNGRVEKCFGLSIPWKSAPPAFFLQKKWFLSLGCKISPLV